MAYGFAGGGDLRIGIADFMTLVENEVVPWIGDQCIVMDEDIRVGSDENSGGGGAHFVDQSVLKKE